MADSVLNLSGGAYPSGDKPEKKKKKKPELPIVPIKNAADYQRMKLERLFANPEKPVVIPVRPKDKNAPPPPEFVRNVMGSSAGAGSGEFHVYRHLRRKEYARQKNIVEKAKVEELDEDFQKKLEENRKLAELKTAKKRAKRLKKKLNMKKKKIVGGDGKDKKGDNSENDSNSSDTDSDSQDTPKAPNNGSNNGNNKQSAGQKNGSNHIQAQITSSNNAKTLGLSQVTSTRDSDSYSSSED